MSHIYTAVARSDAYIAKKMENRGEHFVSEVGVEQSALPESVRSLREIRRSEVTDEVTLPSTFDQVNALGVSTLNGTTRQLAPVIASPTELVIPSRCLTAEVSFYCKGLTPRDDCIVQKLLLLDRTTVLKTTLANSRHLYSAAH